MECETYVYKKERKFFFFIISKGGFYYDPIWGAAKLTTKEEIESEGELYCEGNKVYYKPYIEIVMSNKREHSKIFQTEAEMLAYTNRPEFYRIPLIRL